MQTVRFLILNFNFLHFSMTYGYFNKKGLVCPKLTMERLRQVPRLRRILRGPYYKLECLRYKYIITLNRYVYFEPLSTTVPIPTWGYLVSTYFMVDRD